MKTSTTLAFLFAGATVATPAVSPAEHQKMQRIAEELKKLPNHGQVQPLHHRLSNFGKNGKAPAGSIASGNWGGISVPNSSVTQVSATFVVPDVQLASGDSSSYTWYGCAWVGIDGDDSCSNGSGLWQAGAYWYWTNGGWTYFPFFEWYPAGVQQASLSISPGDNITVEIVADSTTSGTYYFTNHANGQTASGSLSGQAELCEATAEWIVENNNDSGTEMPDFGTVNFEDASFVGASGNTYGTYNGNMYYNGNTNCDTPDDSSVSCTWQS